MAENARSHVFTKEINHASIRSQHVNGNFYVKIVYECFLPWQENRPNTWFLISNKHFKEKVDSMGVVERDLILDKFDVLQLHVMKLYCVLMKSTFI